MNHLLIVIVLIIVIMIGMTLFKRQNTSAEHLPSSPSVTDRTTSCLPKIQKLIPGFDCAQWQKKAEEAFISIFDAISNQDASHLVHTDDKLRKQVDYILSGQQLDGRITPFDKLVIHQTTIYGCRELNDDFYITFQSALECYHYTIKDGNIIKGSQNEPLKRHYNIVLSANSQHFTHFEISN